MTEARDFLASPSSPTHAAHIDIEAQEESPHLDGTHDRKATFYSPNGSVRLRRVARSNTAKIYRPKRRGTSWEPGSEPGLSTNHDGAGGGGTPDLHELCVITVVDFSQERIQLYHLDNYSLGPFLLSEPRPPWALCRWVSVNGMSWDVIKLLGRWKGLHRLAIEDLMNTRNRTKADWYSDHTYSQFPREEVSFNR